MTNVLTERDPVGQWVASEPRLGRVFEDLGIDYCCGGKVPLEQACRSKALSVSDVVRRLQDAADDGDADAVNPDAMTLTELADHIERTHHAFLRVELPRLFTLTQKVAKAHGQRHPQMQQVADLFLAFQDELAQHMMKEERVLFPMVRLMEASSPPPAFGCGSVANPIAVMEHEHDNAGRALAQFRELTSDYTPPADACNTFRVLLDSLRRLEADMHQHVHKENNVLFPKAKALEAA